MKIKKIIFGPLEAVFLKHRLVKKIKILVGLTPLEILSKPARRKTSLTGFTLIEIVISLVIISLTVVGFTSVFISGQKFIRRSILRQQAVNTAQRFMDLLKQEVDGYTWSSGGSPDLDLACAPCWTTISVNIMGSSVTYSIAWTVSEVFPGSGGVRKVNATVSWSLP